MKPLDNYEIWSSRLSEEYVPEMGSDIEESKVFLKEILETPINIFPYVLGWYISAKWSDFFRLLKPNAPINVLYRSQINC